MSKKEQLSLVEKVSEGDDEAMKTLANLPDICNEAIFRLVKGFFYGNSGCSTFLLAMWKKQNSRIGNVLQAKLNINDVLQAKLNINDVQVKLDNDNVQENPKSEEGEEKILDIILRMLKGDENASEEFLAFIKDHPCPTNQAMILFGKNWACEIVRRACAAWMHWYFLRKGGE